MTDKFFALVREARTIDGLSIVTFDWLEDSLMKMYARKETGYLLRRQERASAKVKKPQKAVRKQTTRKGSARPLLPHSPNLFLLHRREKKQNISDVMIVRPGDSESVRKKLPRNSEGNF